MTESTSIAGSVIAEGAPRPLDLARAALAAGRHVLLEAAPDLTVAEAEQLCALADEAGRGLLIGGLTPCHPAFLALRRLVRDGALGPLHVLSADRLGAGDDTGDLAMILALAGQDPDRIEAGGEPGAVTTLHLAFPGGLRAHLLGAPRHPAGQRRLVVIGTLAMAVFDDGADWPAKLVLHGQGAARPVPLVAAEPDTWARRHFADSIAPGGGPRPDGREAVRVLKALARIRPPPPQSAGDAQVHASAYVDAGASLGAGTRVWHFSHILAGSVIGRGCTIGQNVCIGPDVVVGDGCKIQNNVSLYKGVTLADEVFCGPSCVFTNVANPRAGIDRRGEFRPTLVGRGATIGANATIVCGHTLGEYCFIAAGAVVTGDVAPFALMAGNPARRIGWMSHAGHRLDATLTCPATGRRYGLATPDSLGEIPP